jgi:hypothetical protein
MVPFIFITINFGAIALLRYIYHDFLILPLILAYCFGRFGEYDNTEGKN